MSVSVESVHHDIDPAVYGCADFGKPCEQLNEKK